jgi:enoyl-CoA hydratase/carnithine racemase
VSSPRLKVDSNKEQRVEFSSDVLTLEVDGHVATLWLDREEARNAMGSALWRDLPLAAAAIAE